MSVIVLPIATTSEVPYIQSPLYPPTGPMMLFSNVAIEERIAIPELFSTPEIVLRDAEI